MAEMRLGIMGAGAIGGYVGVRAAAAGWPVVMVGRPALIELQDKLRAVDLEGRSYTPQRPVTVTDDPAGLAGCDLCLLTTKSRDTVDAGTVLKDVLAAETPVVSLQNGLLNPARLRQVGLSRVVPGLVTFNVVRDGSEFRQTSSGPIVTETADGHPALKALATALAAAPWHFEPDLAPKQAGKLLINLNNGVCAASGVPVVESLRSRALRKVFALCIREGLAVFKKAGQPVQRLGRISPDLIARVLTWPDLLFFRIAGQMVKVDPRAKASTLQDLERGRPTEIDDLNGAVVRMGLDLGVPTPANAFITDTIKRLEQMPEPVYPRADDILRGCRSAG